MVLPEHCESQYLPILRPLPKSRPISRDWGVYDGEWVVKDGVYQERLVGALDSRGYRPYRNTPEFVRHEAHRHRKWWAHAGGLADFNFLLSFFLKNGIAAEIIARGSAAILIDALGTTWCDSYFLMRAPLADLGAKTTVDFETSSDEELREYNQNDNEVLYAALHNFADVVESFGGRMRTTVASTAMDIFRRQYQAAPAYSTTESVELSRKAYFASDVQVRGREAPYVYIHDINSSFPASMAKGGCPWQYAGKARRKVGDKRAGIVYCQVSAPRSMKHPFLPVRAPNGGVYFPTGNWAGWYTESDIDYADSLGYRIRPLTWMLFERSNDLAGYAKDIYAMRRHKTGFWRLALKFLLNSLYGKFGESTDKEKILLSGPRPSPDALPYQPGAWRVPTTQYLAHEQPHICAWITSLSRIALHQMVIRLEAAGHRVYYNDTDSVMTDAPTIPAPFAGDDLGEWDLAGTIQNAIFEAAKLYSGEVVGGAPGERMIKAKGFAPASSAMRKLKRAIKSGAGLHDAITEVNAIWSSIERGAAVDYAAPRRYKRILAGALPGEDETYKTKRGARLPKRCHVNRAETRPWTYNEVMQQALSLR